jgi:hypothetical protein
MKSNSFLTPLLAALGAVLISGAAWAQNSGTVDDAFQTARQKVAPDVQTKVVSLYGIGTPGTIDKWYIIFYDPTVPSHGRAVLVQKNGGKTYSAALSFDPSRITSEGPALNAAQGYAARHNIAYDSVTALLNQSALNKPFRWKIGLLDVGKSRGFVYVNALDDTVAAYSSPSASSSSSGKSTASSSSDSSTTTAAGLGSDVKKTFLGIGGDLQEFFTGERTVDK